MPLLGIDHVEYYVGNARQAAYYYSKAFGFKVTAYSGPETKVRDRASWVLEQGEARLVFTGSMDWYPNEDAIIHFMEAILPRLRRRIPGLTIAVVGRNPSERLKALGAAKGVQITGTVDDVRPYVAEAAVYVVPLRIGGGTRLKIFEALAMGKAVVSTSVGAEGLPMTPGQHFLQADSPEDFAKAVLALLEDVPRRRAIGEAGRRLVEARYSWAQVGREFERLCEEVASPHAG